MSAVKRIVCVVALVSAWALLPTASAAASNCPNTEVQVDNLSTEGMESSIGCLVNEERTAHGLAPVQPNSSLREAALSHSREMVVQSYFDHTSPAGTTFIDRIEAAGYMRSARSWTVGENLVWGSGPLSTPQSLVTAWMNSPPHRENLLRARFREIGIGAVVGTPESPSDANGVTVSSEYGYRVTAKKKHRGKARKARKARRASRRHAK
ncbi:MAG TPA: CAP domain-containing protein [Solirubrobacterales bacterium]|nr:CAP domain-containing protein [Solirubrobacterales bacterium]